MGRQKRESPGTNHRFEHWAWRLTKGLYRHKWHKWRLMSACAQRAIDCSKDRRDRFIVHRHGQRLATADKTPFLSGNASLVSGGGDFK